MPPGRTRSWPVSRSTLKMFSRDHFDYRRTHGPLSPVQLSRGLSAAQELGETLVDSASLADERLGSQMAVHRAAGMVTVQLDCGIEEALARLRGTAYAEGVTVYQIAAEVEEGRRRFLKEQT